MRAFSHGLVFSCSLLAAGFGTHLANAQSVASEFVEQVEVTGLTRTRASTLLDLLPRQPPARYSDAELIELERRIANLEIFDQVTIERTRPARLRIDVREKWTLVPSFDLAAGTTLEDMYVFLGATEYNLFGTGSALELSVYRERRGFGFHAGFKEHVYRRDRWALAAETSYETSELRFADAGGWFNATALVYLWTTSTPLFSDHLRYEVGAFYKHETIMDVVGSSHPPNGHVLAGSMMFTWDAYQWSDLTPRGWSASLNVSPGFFVGPKLPRSRHQVDLLVKAALRLTSDTALMARLQAGVTSRGNANHSLLIGSIMGVRGLEDSLYFNWAQVFANIELRHALRFASRWALQGVLFVDAGAFEQVTATGSRGESQVALSAGAGLRLIPTWLSFLVLRFDVARTVAPDQTFFFQYGLSQYF